VTIESPIITSAVDAVESLCKSRGVRYNIVVEEPCIDDADGDGVYWLEFQMQVRVAVLDLGKSTIVRGGPDATRHD
jgi:hypothetical protein